MTQQEMENVMQFIVNQQAQFATDMQDLKEQMKDLQQQTKANAEAQSKSQAQMDVLMFTTAKIAEAQIKTEERFQRTDARIAEIAEHVNILTNVVERYFSDNGKGKPQ